MVPWLRITQIRLSRALALVPPMSDPKQLPAPSPPEVQAHLVPRNDADQSAAILRMVVGDVFTHVAQIQEAERKAADDARKSECAHKESLATIDDKQLERREKTIRWTTPPIVLGILLVLGYAVHLGKVTEAASAFAVLATVVGYLKSLVDKGGSRKNEGDKGDKGDKDS